MSNVDSIIQDILNSKKYRNINLSEDTVRELIEIELKHYKKQGDAIQAAKKKLHGIVALYLGDPDYESTEKFKTAFDKNMEILLRLNGFFIGAIGVNMIAIGINNLFLS